MKNPDFNGLWRLDVSRSLLPNTDIVAMSVKIEHSDPKFLQTIKTLQSDGKVTLNHFAGVSTNEEFSNSIHGRSVRSTAKWRGKELVIDSYVETGANAIHLRDHWFLSDDGAELHMEHRDDDLAGQLAVLKRIVE
ncbi:MAG: hypothetical protein WDM89_21575 [Rhizomicrobium sp.]